MLTITGPGMGVPRELRPWLHGDPGHHGPRGMAGIGDVRRMAVHLVADLQADVVGEHRPLGQHLDGDRLRRRGLGLRRPHGDCSRGDARPRPTPISDHAWCDARSTCGGRLRHDGSFRLRLRSGSSGARRGTPASACCTPHGTLRAASPERRLAPSVLATDSRRADSGQLGRRNRSMSTATTRTPSGSATSRASRTSGRTSPDGAPRRHRASARNTRSRARKAGVPLRRLAATDACRVRLRLARVAGRERSLGEHLVDRSNRDGSGHHEPAGVGAARCEDVGAGFPRRR